PAFRRGRRPHTQMAAIKQEIPAFYHDHVPISAGFAWNRVPFHYDLINRKSPRLDLRQSPTALPKWLDQEPAVLVCRVGLRAGLAPQRPMFRDSFQREIETRNDE